LVFCDLLGTQYRPVSKIMSIKRKAKNTPL
jgi:hypothetical protein